MTETTQAAPDTTRNAEDVGVEEARAAWVAEARLYLVEVARSYRSVVTHKELAAAVQERSGIHTDRRVHYWIDGVLADVGRDSAARDEPLISALCVNREGSVGSAYAGLVLELTGEEPADPDDHAARQRLECHRFFEAADLPDGGGTAALVPQLANTRARLKKAAAEARPVQTCPTCYMELLPTGLCDTCD
ncbi:hypothetical protein [Nocardioides halotolerans]|uniref:hypothetical protein n=1 Tax=Nocardioides halotolerans TaxID=433660 RepID=UPI000409E66B|nr:hypothetical protein [Nocardioides halotolerans]